MYKQIYEQWCNNDFFDEDTRKELLAIKDEEEIEDRFYKNLEFGTAGLRGILGAGTNRMNKYTVGKATQGLANFIKKEHAEQRGVAIAYDSRNMSKEFSQITALCLNANGIKTYIFDNLRPVPELSFAVRKLNCIAGVMITASHNAAKYNGYKVYWEDGAQITSPKDKLIIEEVNSIKDYTKIKIANKEESISNKLYNIIGKQMDDDYITEIKKQLLNEEVIKKQKDISIVYTPLHGTGNYLVKRILKEIGFENVNVVKEQEEANGNFPTVEYPNPEDEKAFGLAIKLARQKGAQIVLATDPDADRLGVYVKSSKKDEYIKFTGNMTAILIAEYILSQRQKKNMLPQNGAVIKSIVSSTMINPIAEKYGVKIFEVLTGFKYIGEKIKEFELNKDYNFLFGYEESYGCLAGTHARDKDGIVAVTILCEAAAYYKENGLSLWEKMLQIYNEYGFYKEGVKQVTLEGIDGEKQIQDVMKNLRQNPPKKIGNYNVCKIRDYEKQEIFDCNTQDKHLIDLPKSNVLYYELDNNAWYCVRPSGTEPKIKYYFGVKGNSIQDANEKLEILKEKI